MLNIIFLSLKICPSREFIKFNFRQGKYNKHICMEDYDINIIFWGLQYQFNCISSF